MKKSIGNITAKARPLRIAYLIDLSVCSQEQLDAIFAECYSRWAGRRTLIVPCDTNQGVNKAFERWLEVYDPDIIYSYIELIDEAIIKINEKYCPLILLKHERYKHLKDTDPNYYVPQLPVDGLSSISIYPFFLDRKGLIDFSEKKIIDCSGWLKDIPRFISDNFGVPKLSRLSGKIDSLPDIFQSFQMTSPEHFNNPKLIKPINSEMTIDYNEFIKRISSRNKIVTLSMLSDYMAWQLDCDSPEDLQYFNLVIGDTITDRVLFWNFRSHFRHIGLLEIPDIIVSPENFDSVAETLKDIICICSERSNHGYNITIRSTSLDENTLNIYKDKLSVMIKNSRINVLSCKLDDAVPIMDRKYGSVSFSPSGMWNAPLNTISNIYNGDQIDVPLPAPMHFKDVKIPPSLKSESWMIDLVIDKMDSISYYYNIEHIWKLPRRLRIDRLFNIKYKDTRTNVIHYRRVNGNGLLSIPIMNSTQQVIVGMPNNNKLISGAITNNFDFEPFSREQTKPTLMSRKRYGHTSVSDKGKYFLGVINHFESILDMGHFFLNQFWNTIFKELGADEDYIDPQAIQMLSNYIIKKRSNLIAEDQKSIQIISKKCLAYSDSIKKHKIYISWSKIFDICQELYNQEKNKFVMQPTDEVEERYMKSVERSTQLLCQYKVLFQGQEWTCTDCLNKNWISIEKIRTTLTCEVCGNKEPAPISKDWKFRMNGFILEALRSHGILPLVWTLIELCKEAKSSFFFAQSLKLSDYTNDDVLYEVAEIDLLAVVDGKLYACEVKSSANIDAHELEQFCNVVNTIRPDVALIAVMETHPNLEEKIKSKIIKKIDDGIILKVMTFNAHHFDSSSMLPH